jgi:hypothetical protein
MPELPRILRLGTNGEGAAVIRVTVPPSSSRGVEVEERESGGGLAGS